MKIIKNIAIVAFATSFMFAGIGFHYANNYTEMDAGAKTATSWGVNYALNDNTTVGWDSVMGMIMNFDAPLGVKLRLGWAGSVDGTVNAAFCTDADTDNDGTPDADQSGFDEGSCADPAGDDLTGDGADEPGFWTAESDNNNGRVAQTSVGLGFTWWTGGAGLNTSISTNYDYTMQGTDNSTNLSVTIGFGF